MYTRAEYMSEKCTHREYYSQFVNPTVLAAVERCIGVSRITASTDDFFNDIPLPEWDMLAFSVPGMTCVYDANGDYRGTGDYKTLGGAVCVLKEAARILKERGSK